MAHILDKIEYINAGAGSGKTYKLTELLTDDIKSGKVRPDQVILTTFTRKAAAEFKEKSKAKLFERGLTDEAVLLDGALIGTIHSVAIAIISKFWYCLGIPDSPHAIDEDTQELYISQSLGTIPSLETQERLAGFCAFFGVRFNFWKDQLKQVIAYATNYQIEDFDESRRRSKEFFAAFANPSATFPGQKEITDAINALTILDTGKTSGAAQSRLDKLDKLRRKTCRFNMTDYQTLLEVCEATKTSRGLPEVGPLIEKLGMIWNTPEVYERIVEYIDILFDMAGEWRGKYAEFKEEKKVLDYNDMEKYLLELLYHPYASKEIGRQYLRVYVDEFQDCSPIQVKIFMRLAELAEKSYWVGDMKQAIYGFRGTDTQLTDAVASAVESSPGCKASSLEYSWRSVPGIVEFCNSVFTRAFSPDIPEEKVRLIPKVKPDPSVAPLAVIDAARDSELAEYIACMMGTGIKPAEIAVVARNKSILENLGAQLEELGIPVCRETRCVTGSRAATLAKAVLMSADNEADTLAKATIAYLLYPEFDTERIITESLATASAPEWKTDLSFLDDLPLQARLKQIRPRLRRQAVAQFVESVLLELNVAEEALRICGPDEARAVIQTIIDAAPAYEDQMRGLGDFPTVAGFIDYLDQGEVKIPGDPDGVVLATMHTSKGLEWKYVIVTSLSSNPLKDILSREVFGVHFRRDAEPSSTDFFPAVHIALRPYLFSKRIPESIVRKVSEMPGLSRLAKAKLDEEKRLLYVAMTRPTHQLILLRKGNNPFYWLQAIGIDSPEVLPEAFGMLELAAPKPDEEEPETEEQEEEKRYSFPLPDAPCSVARRNRSPSAEEGISPVGRSYELDARVPLGTLPEGTGMDSVGNCIHHIFQLCAPGRAAEEETMKRLTEAYGLTEALTDIPALGKAWEALCGFIEEKHGPVTRMLHERPFIHHCDGTVIRGSIDLTAETRDGLVLIDFKTSQCSNGQLLDPEHPRYAGRYGAQLACYREALRSAGIEPTATYLFYPLSGLIAEL